MSTNQEQERLKRLRERQLTDRDPLVKQRQHQQISAIKTRKAMRAFSLKESLSAIPRVWYGAFIGLIAGLAVIFILPALWDSPFAVLVGIVATMVLIIFGIVTGNALDLREDIKRDM